MKKTILLIVIAALSLVGCEKAYTDREYTLEELDVDQMSFRPYQSFKDVFPDVAARYKLSAEEELVIGKWIPLQDNAADGIHVIYPNGLYIGYLYRPIKRTTDQWLGHSVGVWNLKSGEVNITIKGFIYVKRIAERNWTYEYRSCVPYEVALFFAEDVDSIGYSKKSFSLVPLPQELKKGLAVYKDAGKKSQYIKLFYSINIVGSLTPQGNLTNDYSYFKYVEEMATKGITGAMIVDDPALREKYVLELLKNL